MDKKLLGKRINIARKERCWTSERLSETCNINATYLRQIESGTKVPSLQVGPVKIYAQIYLQAPAE